MLIDALEITAAFLFRDSHTCRFLVFFQTQVDSALSSVFQGVKSIITLEDIYMFVLSVYHIWRCGCQGFAMISILSFNTEQK